MKSGMKCLLLLVLFGLLTSCASIEKQDEGFKVGAVDAVKYSKLSLEEITSYNDESIQKGENDGLRFFSPATFEHARYYYDKVNKNIRAGKGRQEIIRESELVKKYLQKSYALKDTLSEEFKDILDVNHFIKQLKGHETYSKKYKKFMKRLSAMIASYEKKGTQDAFKDRAPLLADMQKLEAQTTIDKVLGPAKAILDDMKKRNLDNAPISLQEAKSVYDASETSIWENCRDQENLSKVGVSSLFWARRAEFISEETLRLQKLKKDMFESVVLEAEKRLTTIGKALGTDDYRNLSLNQQAAALAEAATSTDNSKKTATVPDVEKKQPVPEKAIEVKI